MNKKIFFVSFILAFILLTTTSILSLEYDDCGAGPNCKGICPAVCVGTDDLGWPLTILKITQEKSKRYLFNSSNFIIDYFAYFLLSTSLLIIINKNRRFIK